MLSSKKKSQKDAWMISRNDPGFICLNSFWTQFQMIEKRQSAESPALKSKIITITYGLILFLHSI